MSRPIDLEIVIDKNGQVQVETLGIKGARCMEVKREFARFLGRILSEEKTGEFYEVEQTGLRRLFGKRRKG